MNETTRYIGLPVIIKVLNEKQSDYSTQSKSRLPPLSNLCGSSTNRVAPISYTSIERKELQISEEDPISDYRNNKMMPKNRYVPGKLGRKLAKGVSGNASVGGRL